MDRFRRAPLFIAVASLFLGAVSPTGQDAATATPRLTPAEIETFLLEAAITNTRDAGAGVTRSLRVTMTDGRITHDAHVQSVDVEQLVFKAGAHSELNFKDTYRFNIAAYRLARLLKIDNVPASVERIVDGKRSAVTWWVDDVQMDETSRVARKTMGPDPLRTANQIQLLYIWDELIQNRDRNGGNVIWTMDWTLRLIDHTRAFRLEKNPRKPEEIRRCDRGLLGRLKVLTDDSIEKAVGDSLTQAERRAVLARRDRIVRIIEDRVAKFGEGAVLVDS